MSIATKRGDGGQTGLAGGVRVSKADLRVESYGSIDELNTVLGFARSICESREIRAWIETIQRTLFRVGSALATTPESSKKPPVVSLEDVNMLSDVVYQIESTQGIRADSLPGGQTQSAAYEVARANCRRAERAVIRFVESGGVIQSAILPYLNRLSDVICLIARLTEVNASVESRLRVEAKRDPKWPGARDA